MHIHTHMRAGGIYWSATRRKDLATAVHGQDARAAEHYHLHGVVRSGAERPEEEAGEEEEVGRQRNRSLCRIQIAHGNAHRCCVAPVRHAPPGHATPRHAPAENKLPNGVRMGPHPGRAHTHTRRHTHTLENETSSPFVVTMGKNVVLLARIYWRDGSCICALLFANLWFVFASAAARCPRTLRGPPMSRGPLGRRGPRLTR